MCSKDTIAVLTVAEAEKIILEHCFDPGIEELPLAETRGRILREDLRADRDFPPFDRVTMDGIAIRCERFEAGQRVFPVAGMQPAGMPPLRLEQPGACVEVMTGAMLPEGTDTVIRYEDLEMTEGRAEIQVDAVQFRQNIHYRGQDRRAGELIVPAGRLIAAPEIATAATVGKARLKVTRLPRVAIISTGDELVPPQDTPLPHQIRRSNVYAVQAVLAEQFGITGDLFHFIDDKAQIAEGLARVLTDYELVILTGAVSEGKFDFVPEVLHDLGVEKRFHKVAQRPGKPFWFGQQAGRTVIFALPGNPVSVFMCLWRYVVPFLRRSMGLADLPQHSAVLAETVVFKPQLAYFLPVKLDNSRDGQIRAFPLPGHGSGDLANLNDADAFLALPLERDHFGAGESFPLLPYR